MKIIFNQVTKLFSIITKSDGSWYRLGEREKLLDNLSKVKTSNDFSKPAIILSKLAYGQELTQQQEQRVKVIATELVNRYINEFNKDKDIYPIRQFIASVKPFASNIDKLNKLMIANENRI